MLLSYGVSVDPKATTNLVAVVRSDASGEVADLRVAFPKDPGREAVHVVNPADSDSPLASISGPRARREIRGGTGELIAQVSAQRAQSILRTLWVVTDPGGDEIFRMVERLGDGLWRRLVRPFPRALSEGATDLFGAILLAPLFIFLRAKPSCRMTIRDTDGQAVGSVVFASNAKRPREDFSVELPIGDSTIGGVDAFTAALAAVTVMR